jgi:hypothetical protein
MVTAQTGAGVSSQVSASVSAAITGTTGSAPGPSGPVRALNSRNPAPSAPVEAAEPETRVISGENNMSGVAVRESAATSAIPRTPAAPGKSHAAGGEGGYAGFGSFPDSTRGDAEISPPDPGTSSPLQWSPGFEFEFSDFQSTQFLNPTLNAGGPVSHPPRAHTPAGVPAYPGLKTQLGKPTLHKSIDQQVGLLGAH